MFLVSDSLSVWHCGPWSSTFSWNSLGTLRIKQRLLSINFYWICSTSWDCLSHQKIIIFYVTKFSHHWDSIPTTERVKFKFGLWFQRLHSIVRWLQDRSIMVEGNGRGNVPNSCQGGEQENKGKEEEVRSTRSTQGLGSRPPSHSSGSVLH